MLGDGNNDPIMIPQVNTNHNWINTNKPPGLGTDLSMTEPIDSNKEGHLQSRPRMNVTRGQSHKEPKENLTKAFKQVSSTRSDQQLTKQLLVCQPTLHNLENRAYRMNERGNLRNGISIHGPGSQDPRTLLTILMEATNSAAKTPARQFWNIANT